MSNERKTVADVAMAELWQLEKERYAMATNQNQNQPQQQQVHPALQAHHHQAMQAAGVDPARLRGLNLAQILALIQAILAAVGPLIPSGGGGNNPTPTPNQP